MSKNEKTIGIGVKRFDPSSDKEPRCEEFRVPYVQGDTYEDRNHSLAVEYSSKVGGCSICNVTADGKPVLACQERVRDAMTNDPISNYALVRDLVVDLRKRHIGDGWERKATHQECMSALIYLDSTFGGFM